MLNIFKNVSRILSGKTLLKLVSTANKGSTHLELHLKTKSQEHQPYVVLASKSSGNYQYAVMTKSEFAAFQNCVEAIASMMDDYPKDP